MKPTVLIFALLISCISTFAQDVKEITRIGPNYVEEYYVLKSDKNIKHGRYRQLTSKLERIVITNGYYNYGKKDSIWTFYHWGTKDIHKQGRFKDDQKEGVWYEYGYKNDKKILLSEGAYEDGVRVGEWEFFNDGKLHVKYNYSTKELLYFNDIDSLLNEEYEIYLGSEIIVAKLQSPPLYLGDYSWLKNRNYQECMSGIVTFSCLIDPIGMCSDFKIVEGIGYNCSENEALRIIKTMPQEWIPAIYQGKKVKVRTEWDIWFFNNSVVVPSFREIQLYQRKEERLLQERRLLEIERFHQEQQEKLLRRSY